MIGFDHAAIGRSPHTLSSTLLAKGRRAYSGAGREKFSDEERVELERIGLGPEEIGELQRVLPLVAALRSQSAGRNKVLRILEQGAKETPKGCGTREQFARAGSSMDPAWREISARLTEPGGSIGSATTWRRALRKLRGEIARAGQGRHRVSALAVDVVDRALRRARAKRLVTISRNGGARRELDQYREYSPKERLQRIAKTLRISSSPESAYYNIMRVCLGTDPERSIRAYKAARKESTNKLHRRIDDCCEKGSRRRK